MIRVNLLRSLGLVDAPAGSSAAVTLGAEEKKQAGIKMLVAFIPMLCVIGYERMALSTLHDELAKLNGELRGVEKEISTFGNDAPKVAEFKTREKKVEDEMKVIRKLAAMRLRDVKALDALQNVLPEKTWFDSITMDNGITKLVGFSTSDTGTDELMDGLKNTVFFSDIEIKKVESAQAMGAPAKRFELEFKIGKKDEAK